MESDRGRSERVNHGYVNGACGSPDDAGRADALSDHHHAGATPVPHVQELEQSLGAESRTGGNMAALSRGVMVSLRWELLACLGAALIDAT